MLSRGSFLWCVMKFKSLCKREGFLGTEGLVEGTHIMRVEVGLDDSDLLRLWVSGRQLFHQLCLVLFSPLVTNLR